MTMKCPQCDFENEEGSKFCKNCSEPLVKFKIPNAIENSYIKIKEEDQPEVIIRGGNKMKGIYIALKSLPFSVVTFLLILFLILVLIFTQSKKGIK